MKHIIKINSSHTLLDKFYTKPKIAEFCVSFFQSNVTVNKNDRGRFGNPCSQYLNKIEFMIYSVTKKLVNILFTLHEFELYHKITKVFYYMVQALVQRCIYFQRLHYFSMNSLIIMFRTLSFSGLRIYAITFLILGWSTL